MMHAESAAGGAQRFARRTATRPARSATLAGLLVALAAGLPGSTYAAQPAAARAPDLTRMSDAEKAAVLQKKRRFDELRPVDRQRLRQLHQELSRDPRQAQLQQVLTQYYDWLRTLNPAERAELLSLPADQRLVKIQELRSQQQAKRRRMMAAGFMMSPADLTVIYNWFDQFLADHHTELRAALPDDPTFADLKHQYDHERDHHRLRFDYTFRRDPDRPRPTPEEVARLQTLVSPEAQQVLANASPDERQRIVLFWIGAAVLSRMQTNPSLEELDQFVQDRNFVSDAERQWLESLPRDRMYRELRVWYKQRRFAGDPSKRSPWDRGPGSNRSPGWAGGSEFEGPSPSVTGPDLAAPDQ
ncbi:MAG: hypothetical protein GXY58_05005 [Planctomycetaceae bacterium]|nr:hypothetical protein [Planctomycetaceae bacterium]